MRFGIATGSAMGRRPWGQTTIGHGPRGRGVAGNAFRVSPEGSAMSQSGIYRGVLELTVTTTKSAPVALILAAMTERQTAKRPLPLWGTAVLVWKAEYWNCWMRGQDLNL